MINKWNRLNAFRLTFHADLKLAIIGAPETDGKGYPSLGSPHCLSPSLTHTHTHISTFILLLILIIFNNQKPVSARIPVTTSYYFLFVCHYAAQE